MDEDSIHESGGKALSEELHAQLERKVKEMKRAQEQIENEFDTAHDQWRDERRRLNGRIEVLEESLESAKEDTRREVSGDLQSESRFRLKEALVSRRQLEEELAAAIAKWESERSGLKNQIDSMQRALIDGIERSNNPARMTMGVRMEVEARVASEKTAWQIPWENERKRLVAELEHLRQTPRGGNAQTDNAQGNNDRKETARRALLQKLGKPPAASSPRTETADELKAAFNEAKILWENQRDAFNVTIQGLQDELQRASGRMRAELLQELRSSYEPRLAEEVREAQRLGKQVEFLDLELGCQRQRLTARIEQLEASIPEAQEAVRKQVTAELAARMEGKIEEAARVKARLERRFQDVTEELADERRRDKKQISQLQEQIRSTASNSTK